MVFMSWRIPRQPRRVTIFSCCCWKEKNENDSQVRSGYFRTMSFNSQAPKKGESVSEVGRSGGVSCVCDTEMKPIQLSRRILTNEWNKEPSSFKL